MKLISGSELVLLYSVFGYLLKLTIQYHQNLTLLYIDCNNWSADIPCREPGKDSTGWLPKACFCRLPTSEHRQPGTDICDKIAKLVLCWATWSLTCHCFLHRSTGNDSFPLLYCPLLLEQRFPSSFSHIITNVQMQIATLIAVYADWGFAAIKGIGWGWAGVIWLYNIIFYFPLDIIKFLIRYALSGKAWDLVIEQRVIRHFGISNS